MNDIERTEPDDELDLAPETVEDLDADDETDGRVRGGLGADVTRTTHCACP